MHEKDLRRLTANQLTSFPALWRSQRETGGFEAEKARMGAKARCSRLTGRVGNSPKIRHLYAPTKKPELSFGPNNFGSPLHSLNKIPIIIEIEFKEPEMASQTSDIPSIVNALSLAREIRQERLSTESSMPQIARNRVLTTTRIFQLLQLLDLPEDILVFIDSLAGKHLGARFLTERKVRSWIGQGDSSILLKSFQDWKEQQKDKLSVEQ